MRRSLLCLAALLVISLRLAVAPGVSGADTAPLRVDVTLVTLPLLVTDQNGQLQTNLHRDDFVVRDQGVEQQVKYLWREVDLPLTLGLIIDISSSQMGLLRSHRDVMAQFLAQVVGPEDRAFVVTVNEQARLLADITNSQANLRGAIAQLEMKPTPGALFGEPCRGMSAKHRNPESCLGTPIWDTVLHAARNKLRAESGRKALILITDGIDSGGSQHGLHDAIEAAQAANAPVYAIRFRSSAYLALNPIIATTLAFDHGLDKLALDTGGRLYANPKNHLAETFSQIEEELRSQYIIGYFPEPPSSDSVFHKVQIRTRNKNLIVRAAKGYSPQPPPVR